jgi:hypothetical protein
MPTFPKSLATLRRIVDERGERLRQLTFENLKDLKTDSIEHLTVESRPATISIFVQPKSDGSLGVVVQGFMKARFVPGKHVALDGFYKHPDGAVTPMPISELNEFD